MVAGLTRPADQAEQAGEVRKTAGQVLQQIIKGRPLEADARQLPIQLEGRRPRGGKELVHVEAVAQLAGDAASGGVGLGEQAPLLKGPHGGAHRGRAGGQAEAPHQGVAAHRLHRVHVVPHGGLQHLLLPAWQALQGTWAAGMPAIVGSLGPWVMLCDGRGAGGDSLIRPPAMLAAAGPESGARHWFQ